MRAIFSRTLTSGRGYPRGNVACSIAFLLALAFGLEAAAAAGDPLPYLLLTTAGGETIVEEPLPPDHAWKLEWTHSVAQVQIVDVFVWRDGKMYVTDQFTPHLDIAGLGSYPERGELMTLPGGGYRLANIDLPLHGNAHGLIIGTSRAPTVLHVGKNRYLLSETHPGTHARIGVTLR